MKNYMRLILVYVFLLSLLISGCSAEGKEATRYDNSLYSITMENGQYYLNPNITPASVNTSHVLTYPEFLSIAEMRQSIISGTFTEANLYALSFGDKNEDGSIPICDLDNMFECTTPSGFEISNIVWFGKYYLFNFSGETAWGALRCCDADTYTDNFNNGYKDFLTNPNVTLTEQQEIEERSATVYYGTTSMAKMKYICYEIITGNRNIFIQEEYLLEADHDLLKKSSDVPLSIHFWGTGHSGYFYGGLHDLIERPSVEWLSEFGLVPYVDSSAS